MITTPHYHERNNEEKDHESYEGHKAPWDAFWGQRYAMIRDPDGNEVDLFAPLS